MVKKAARKQAKKALKVVFAGAANDGRSSKHAAKKTTSAKEGASKGKHKKKASSYVVDDDTIKLMRRQLAGVGCKLHEVEADGNCLFRALGDQLYGDQHEHEQVRKLTLITATCGYVRVQRIVDYLEQHRDDFEPFMEDEEKFERYCERMREDGTWGGNQELYAAARLFQVYVVVHQDQPSARVMVIECDRLKPNRIVHVAYHGEDHYDSVRSLRDAIEPGSLPEPIELGCDGFRPADLAQRWQTHASGTDGSSIVPSEAQTHDPEDVQAEEALASRLQDQLQVSDAAGASVGSDGASKRPLSKKAQRQLRQAARRAAKRG